MRQEHDPFDLPVIPVPAVAFPYARHARIIREGFWKKILRHVGRAPFAEDLVAAYFCVIDPATPSRVRGLLLVALAWFVIPGSALPEFLVVFGLTDDVAVLAMAAGMVRRHIKERHYQRARALLRIPEPVDEEDEIWG